MADLEMEMDVAPAAAPRADADALGAWLEAFGRAVADGDADAAAALFAADCHWRDVLAFTWTIGTLDGPQSVRAMLADRLASVAPGRWRLTEHTGTVHGLAEGWVAFDTALGPAIGAIRLRNGKAVHFYSALTDLAGFEEPVGRRRPIGVTHEARRDRLTWTEERARETRRMGYEDEPYCLVVGGGQGGLALAARLRTMGVPSLVVEKNPRAGDSWRNRYRSLVLHDPVWYDHMPYLDFPRNWPVFTPKDKMGDWLEMYARVMELPLWTSTTCETASWDPDSESWTVKVSREGERVTLHPKQLVFATGAYGPPRRIDYPGAGDFRGELIHSADYQGGERYAGKRCVVIGAASSAHDVAVDLWESGAEVTMVQRSPSTVVRSDTLMRLGFEIYSEDALDRGISVDRADHMTASVPLDDMAAWQRALYERIRAEDADFYERLSASGFLIDFGPDESGLMMKAMRTGSGYYIDVGASDLIIDGEIGIVGGDGVAGFTEDGVTLESGRVLKADLVVACIGYQSMHEMVARIVSRDVADRVGPCWGLGSGVPGDPGPWKGDPRNMWKPTAQPGLWFHGGNLALSRFYSKYLAMQIKARMEGIAPRVYPGLAPVPEA